MTSTEKQEYTKRRNRLTTVQLRTWQCLTQAGSRLLTFQKLTGKDMSEIIDKLEILEKEFLHTTDYYKIDKEKI